MDEARIEETEHGLVPQGGGWWVLNARDMRWVERDGRGRQVPFTGWTDEEAEGFHVEGEERLLQKWDYFHCPPGVSHTILGAGAAGCVVLAMSSRVYMGGDDWGAYTVDPVATKHRAGVEEETTDADEAYSRWAPSRAVRYGSWLPGDW